MSVVNTLGYSVRNKAEGQAKAIFTVGIAGSGKSHHLAEMANRGWQVLNLDAERVRLLREGRAQNKKLKNSEGEEQLMDPSRAEHIFHSELREKVWQIAEQKVEDLAQQKQSMVLDFTNLNLRRTPFIYRLRKHGYWIEALRFKPKALEVHERNIALRVDSGGIDIARFHDPKEKTQQRLAILKELKANYDLFCSPLKCDPSYQKPRNQVLETSKIDWKAMKSAVPPFEAYMKTRPPEEQFQIQALLEEDIFNEVIDLEVHESRP